MLQPSIADADVSVPALQEGTVWTPGDSVLPLIQEKLTDADFSASEVLRLISTELARLIAEMYLDENATKKRLRVRISAAQIRMLRALADSVRRLHALRKKEDVLDLDGPKFTFVLDELVKCFQQALQQSLGRDNQTAVQSAMRHFRDIAAMREPELRQELQRMS